MNKLFLIKLLSCSKQKHFNSGFSLIEVLVTILVVTGFILGSLQAVVLSTVLRVQGQDKNEALNWIQQDLELIRFQAFNLDLVGGNYVADSCGSYGQDLKDAIDTDPDDPNDPHPENQTITIGGNSYDVTRTYTNAGNTLQITHNIVYNANHPRFNTSASDNNVTTLSTEVIPNVALTCP